MPTAPQFGSSVAGMSEKSTFGMAAVKRTNKGKSEFGADLTSGDQTFHTQPQPEHTYSCPLYRTTERFGELKTDGHSSNFIIMIETPIPGDIRHSKTEPRLMERMGSQEDGKKKEPFERL